MEFEFYKYQGTGNDFVLIDNRQQQFPKNDTKQIAHLCDRKFGIGADGLILLEDHDSVDFTMVYYNSDGQPSSMCGNGGRCIVHFARHLGVITDAATFEAIDGMHSAQLDGDRVSLKMNDVDHITAGEGHVFLDTGSPHHVEMVTGLENYDVFAKGRHIRQQIYGSAGSNVNFVEAAQGTSDFKVRTYERGVEDETLSCGTGVTAVALAMHFQQKTTENQVRLHTPGGELTVTYTPTNSGYTNIYLEGPATQVFKGYWT